jgi:hypothetical protein
MNEAFIDAKLAALALCMRVLDGLQDASDPEGNVHHVINGVKGSLADHFSDIEHEMKMLTDPVYADAIHAVEEDDADAGEE